MAASCGSKGAHPGATTLRGVLGRPGPDVALVAGDSDFSTGPIRLSFLVIRQDASGVSRPIARVWVAKSLDAKPFAQVTASAKPIGIPGGSFGYDSSISRFHVAHFSIQRPASTQ